MVKKMVKLRNSNFELLRIISMLMIILHHFVVHSYYHPIVNNTNFINDFVIFFFRSGGKLGVALFTMITGYFMVYSKGNIKKILSLECQVLFTSIIIFLVFVFLNNDLFTFKNILKYFLPNISKTFWFFSSYFVLYFFIPYINKLFLSLGKKEFLRLLIIGFLFLILLPSIFEFRSSINNTIYLFYYYMLGAFIRIFDVRKWGKLKSFCGFSFSYLLVVLISLLIREFSFDYPQLENYIFYFSKIDNIFIFSSSLYLFLFFKSLNLGNISVINKIASTSFGVYLFHDHLLMRDFLWKKTFSIVSYVDNTYLVFYGVIVAVIIYMAGSFFELFRKFIFRLFFLLFNYFKGCYLKCKYYFK